MNIAVDSNNPFHLGWLACFLGLPRRLPHAAALKPEHISAFEDGWDTCSETPTWGHPNRNTAFVKMLCIGQAVTFWVDDDNNEIPA